MRLFIPLILVWLLCMAVPGETQTGSFWEKILRIAGISATPSTLKGPGDELEAGDIWVVNLTHKTPRRLTRDGGYRSPVFGPGEENILVLKGDDIMRFSVFGGDPVQLHTVKGAFKLVGFSLDERDQVLVLTEDDDGRLAVGLLSLQSGQVTLLPYNRTSRQHRRLLIHMKGWERVYGNTTLYVKRETRQDMGGPTQWTDVYMKRGDNDPLNLSRCNGVPCGQPSLSPDEGQVVFIKAVNP